MIDAVAAAIIGAVVGGLFVIAAVFIQRGKRVITYEITSMPLLQRCAKRMSPFITACFLQLEQSHSG